MPLDGITAKALSYELDTRLKDARVDKIYQPGRYDLVLHLRLPGEQLKLLLSANPASPRLHLTENNRKNPDQPPMFCMLIRKHLLGARLLSVHTPDYERIFIFKFQTTNELGDTLEKRLIVEIMGRHSNIILINQDDRIHDAISHVDSEMSRVREVMPARPYDLPPTQNKLTPETIMEKIDAKELWFLPSSLPKSLEKALLESCQGFSPQLALEAAELSGIDPRTRLMQLDEASLTKVDRAVYGLLDRISRRQFQPSLYYISSKDPIPVDFHALNLTSYAIRKDAGSVSEALETFYEAKDLQNTISQKRQYLQKVVGKELDHTNRKYQIHLADCKEGEKRELYKQYGELILGNIQLVDAALRQGQNQVELTNYYTEDQQQITVNLQTNRTASWNAQQYFRKYNKARSKHETGQRLADQDLNDLIWLENLAAAVENAQDLDDLRAIKQEAAAAGLLAASRDRKAAIDNEQAEGVEQLRQDKINRLNPGRPGKAGKKKNPAFAGNKQGKKKKAAAKGSARQQALPPRKYLSSDNFEILVGRNNLQNDQLTLKTAQKDDLWLHVQKIHGTHVIIRSNHQEIPDQTLLEAAGIALWFSKASLAGGAKAPVDYCPVANVRKPGGARPGMVIYEHYKTIITEPLDPQDLAVSYRENQNSEEK